MLESVDYDNTSLFLSKEFHLKTNRSKYIDASRILKDGFTRLLDVITTNNVSELNSKLDDFLLLHGMNVVVHSEADEVYFAFSFGSIFLSI